MKVKCGRVEFDLNEKDVVMYNGQCFQIITRKFGSGWNQSTPLIAKDKARKLIKEGSLKKIEIENPPHKGESILYYTV